MGASASYRLVGGARSGSASYRLVGGARSGSASYRLVGGARSGSASYRLVGGARSGSASYRLVGVEMLTQRALFCHHANTKRGTLSQHFVTHVIPPLWLGYGCGHKGECQLQVSGCGCFTGAGHRASIRDQYRIFFA